MKDATTVPHQPPSFPILMATNISQYGNNQLLKEGKREIFHFHVDIGACGTCGVGEYE